MKFILRILALAIVGLAPVPNPNTVRSAPPARPMSYWRLALAPYSQFRVDYDLLPVQVVGIRGGGPRPEDSFKVEATRLKNQTAKTIKSVRVTWYLFNAGDLNVALDSRQTDIVKLELKPFELADFEVFVVYANEIPLFKASDKAEDFRLEVAVTEVHYDDGSIWQVTDLPKKLDPSKTPKSPGPQTDDHPRD
jgi:hypothetical protein